MTGFVPKAFCLGMFRPALKQLCRQRKLKVTGTKAVLLGRLTELSQTHTSKNTQEVDRIHLPKHKAVASCSEFIDREVS